MNTTSIIDKIDSHRLEDYRTLNKVIQIRKRFGFLVKISWLIYENQFRIRPVDYKIIFQLLGYFYAVLENSAHLEMNLKNGILLSGRVSYGKTSLTFLMHHFLAKETQCTMVATRDICLELFMDTISRSCICKMCFLDQKTSCPEVPLEKSFASQLGGLKKKSNDMKQLSNSKIKTDKLLKFYVSGQDYELLKAEFESSGYKSMSAYLRRPFIGNGIIFHRPKVLLASLDVIGTEINRIGNNVNQIAKKAHFMEKDGVLTRQLILEFNEEMAVYNENAKELARAYRKLLRKMS